MHRHMPCKICMNVMCMCLCVCMHICMYIIHTHTHTHTHMFVSYLCLRHIHDHQYRSVCQAHAGQLPICSYKHSIYVYVCVYVCMLGSCLYTAISIPSASMYACMYVFMCVCMYAGQLSISKNRNPSMCVRMYVYMYVCVQRSCLQTQCWGVSACTSTPCICTHENAMYAVAFFFVCMRVCALRVQQDCNTCMFLCACVVCGFYGNAYLHIQCTYTSIYNAHIPACTKHIHTYTYIHTYTQRTYIHTYIHTCVPAYRNMPDGESVWFTPSFVNPMDADNCKYISMCICICVCIRVYFHVYLYLCMYSGIDRFFFCVITLWIHMSVNMCACVSVCVVCYWRLHNNCSPSDRFITVQCRIFAQSVLFCNGYYKQ
jgi:hypothetical protein